MNELKKCPIPFNPAKFVDFFRICMNELKNCPFCGSKVRVGIGAANSYFIVHTGWQESKCPIRFTNVIPDADTPEKAAEAWNRRATDDE